MSTLHELLKNSTTQEIQKMKLRRCSWTEYGHFFTPYFLVDDCYTGIEQHKNLTTTKSYDNRFYLNWTTYKEPPTKVKKWLWLRGASEVTRVLLTEEEVSICADDPDKYTKLLWSETEVEVAND